MVLGVPIFKHIRVTTNRLFVFLYLQNILSSLVRKYFTMSKQGECCLDKMLGLQFGRAKSLSLVFFSFFLPFLINFTAIKIIKITKEE